LWWDINKFTAIDHVSQYLCLYSASFDSLAFSIIIICCVSEFSYFCCIYLHIFAKWCVALSSWITFVILDVRLYILLLCSSAVEQNEIYHAKGPTGSYPPIAAWWSTYYSVGRGHPECWKQWKTDMEPGLNHWPGDPTRSLSVLWIERLFDATVCY